MHPNDIILRGEKEIFLEVKTIFIYITFLKPYHYILKNQIRHLPRKGRFDTAFNKISENFDFIFFSC